MAKNLTINGHHILCSRQLPSGEYVIIGFNPEAVMRFAVAVVPTLQAHHSWGSAAYKDTLAGARNSYLNALDSGGEIE